MFLSLNSQRCNLKICTPTKSSVTELWNATPLLQSNQNNRHTVLYSKQFVTYGKYRRFLSSIQRSETYVWPMCSQEITVNVLPCTDFQQGPPETNKMEGDGKDDSLLIPTGAQGKHGPCSVQTANVIPRSTSELCGHHGLAYTASKFWQQAYWHATAE